MTSTNSLRASISGERWWGGFTAEITLTNTSTQDLSSWSYSFDSPHLINTAPWGAEISAVLLDNGLSRYTLTGDGWGERIPAGKSVTIGFNGTQGTDLGNEGGPGAGGGAARVRVERAGACACGPSTRPIVVR